MGEEIALAAKTCAEMVATLAEASGHWLDERHVVAVQLKL
jgi:hypothetical protein